MAKIVLLGCEPEVRQSNCCWLLAEGHYVRTAQTGADAIDLGYLFVPDVLVTEWRLNCDYNGVEVAKAMRFANGKTKTILITDDAATSVIPEAATANIFQTLVKPLSRSLLVGAVSMALALDRVAISYE
jgi:DNA-binding NtrC family response regulator